MKAKALRAQRAKLIEDARALVNERYATADDHRRFDSMMAEADHIKAQLIALSGWRLKSMSCRKH